MQWVRVGVWQTHGNVVANQVGIMGLLLIPVWMAKGSGATDTAVMHSFNGEDSPRELVIANGIWSGNRCPYEGIRRSRAHRKPIFVVALSGVFDVRAATRYRLQ
jgi:SUMO ligase MMS21 Smc5/6 complex component